MNRHRRTFTPIILRIVTPTLLAALAVFTAQFALADDYRQFPGVPTDNRSLKVQQRVEEIYSSGEYDRALFIYEKELAPKGDKYAQYMVGFMHLTGKAVEEDPAEALAWYRLAAERGEPSFIRARDALRETLDPDQLQKSEEVFAGLWRRYSDRKLILDLIRSDLDILRRESSRRVAEANPSVTIAAGYSGTETSEGYFRRVRVRLSERLQYLGSTDDATDAGIAADAKNVTSLEKKIRRELKALDLP